MLCAISGESPQVPAVSHKTGNVYERRLIEAYVAENGTEPTTGESLTVEDLIDLKAPRAVRPRPPSLTSIPALLGVFQEEWDALALETYTLQQNLAQTRQELSTALYQHDAAVRVIARLARERDEARDALSKISVGRTNGAAADGEAMQVDSAPLPEAIVAKVDATKEQLMKTRRKRPVPEDWADADSISTYSAASTSKPLYPGGSALAWNAPGELALVGGTDGVAGVYSLAEDRVVQSLKGGGGSITSGLWAGSRAVVSTASGRVKVFEGQNEIGSFGSHAGSANAVTLHPSGDILASVGEDKTYVLYDLESMRVLTQVTSTTGFTCAQFHPDGHLLAAGGLDGQIRVFDVNSGTEAATFDVGTPLKALCFSENGTWLAAVAQRSSSVGIWDLRKTAQIKSLEIGSPVEAISWDYTGQYLMAGGPAGVTVEQYSKASKEWSEILTSATPATAVAWGQSARSAITLNSEGAVTVLSSGT